VKAILLVAGAGTKLRPLTYTQPKALIPLGGRTLLSVLIDQILEAGITRFIFVIGYLGDKIEDYLKENYPNLDYELVVQNDRKGTGHAVWLTQKFVEPEEDILIVLGDTIVDYDLKSLLSQSVSQVGVKKVDDPRSFGVAEMKNDGTLVHVVEKPNIPMSNMALVGIYFIKNSNHLYAALEQNLKTPRGEEEHHLTEALQTLIELNVPLKAFKVNNWFDCGKKETILSTNAILLKQSQNGLDAAPYHHGSSIIIPPVSIAKGCVVENSIVGPNVTLGENSKVSFSIIQDSIIGSFTTLHTIALNNSIIGSDAFIKGKSQNLNIGDNTEIDFT